MTNKRNQYTREFKLEAISLCWLYLGLLSNRETAQF